MSDFVKEEIEMPNIKSQKKRMRQAEKRALRNRAIRSRIKTYISYFQNALGEKDLKKAEEFFRLVSKYLDKAVSKGVIHKNRAADKKSRFSQKLNLLKKELEEASAKEPAEERKSAKKESSKKRATSKSPKKTTKRTSRKKAAKESS